jgi:hypothetical protein
MIPWQGQETVKSLFLAIKPIAMHPKNPEPGQSEADRVAILVL